MTDLNEACDELEAGMVYCSGCKKWKIFPPDTLCTKCKMLQRNNRIRAEAVREAKHELYRCLMTKEGFHSPTCDYVIEWLVDYANKIEGGKNEKSS